MMYKVFTPLMQNFTDSQSLTASLRQKIKIIALQHESLNELQLQNQRLLEENQIINQQLAFERDQYSQEIHTKNLLIKELNEQLLSQHTTLSRAQDLLIKSTLPSGGDVGSELERTIAALEQKQAEKTDDSNQCQLQFQMDKSLDANTAQLLTLFEAVSQTHQSSLQRRMFQKLALGQLSDQFLTVLALPLTHCQQQPFCSTDSVHFSVQCLKENPLVLRKLLLSRPPCGCYTSAFEILANFDFVQRKANEEDRVMAVVEDLKHLFAQAQPGSAQKALLAQSLAESAKADFNASKGEIVEVFMRQQLVIMCSIAAGVAYNYGHLAAQLLEKVLPMLNKHQKVEKFCQIVAKYATRLLDLRGKGAASQTYIFTVAAAIMHLSTQKLLPDLLNQLADQLAAIAAHESAAMHSQPVLQTLTEMPGQFFNQICQVLVDAAPFEEISPELSAKLQAFVQTPRQLEQYCAVVQANKLDISPLLSLNLRIMDSTVGFQTALQSRTGPFRPPTLYGESIPVKPLIDVNLAQLDEHLIIFDQIEHKVSAHLPDVRTQLTQVQAVHQPFGFSGRPAILLLLAAQTVLNQRGIQRVAKAAVQLFLQLPTQHDLVFLLLDCLKACRGANSDEILHALVYADIQMINNPPPFDFDRVAVQALACGGRDGLQALAQSRLVARRDCPKVLREKVLEMLRE